MRYNVDDIMTMDLQRIKRLIRNAKVMTRVCKLKKKTKSLLSCCSSQRYMRMIALDREKRRFKMKRQ